LRPLIGVVGRRSFELAALRSSGTRLPAVVGATRILAVQWHPEPLAVASATDAAVFADLVERARRQRLAREGVAA
jgi:putative glutamine amidotransferase